MLVVAGSIATPAFAQVSVNISIAPPAPLYETAPSMAPGYVWVPGYWAWHGDQYIWVRGRTVVQRAGYRWEPDRWEQRDHGYYRLAGRWERDVDYKAVKMKKEKKPKHHDKGHGNDGFDAGKPGKGHRQDR
jgi:hypothetical protein